MSSSDETVDVVFAEVREMAPATVAEIVSGTGLAESTVRRALEQLETAGMVESDSYSRRARVWTPCEDR